jgi:CPA1 family monovalent cation:H+ antiporter
MALAFAPGVPRVELDPELALALFLPPLLMASAWRTDWQAFRRDLSPILLLAVGCVAFTAFAVGALAKLLLPDLPWAAAIALGAILAPPDAVAAAAVLARLKLPPRIVTVLEGESLLNDASALVLYRLAVTAAAAGGFSALGAAGGFVLLGAGGVAVGWALAWACNWLIARLGDTLLEIALSFLAAFASYLLAEHLHLSGVMAVVTTGIVMGRARHRTLSARTRLNAVAVWGFVEFVLTSLVFILIGLQLNGILERVAARGSWELAWLAGAISLGLIASRFLWLMPANWLSRLVPAVRRRESATPWRHVVILGWAGMRGVVSLAAALALPLGFPERDLIVFLAFCAILATLVVQGTTLEWLIRRLGVREAPPPHGILREESVARHVAGQAMLEAVEKRAADVLYGPIASDMLPEFRDRARHLHRVRQGGGAAAAERAARRAVRLEALAAARHVLHRGHEAGEFDEEILNRITQELDLEEGRLRGALG